MNEISVANFYGNHTFINIGISLMYKFSSYCFPISILRHQIFLMNYEPIYLPNHNRTMTKFSLKLNIKKPEVAISSSLMFFLVLLLNNDGQFLNWGMRLSPFLMTRTDVMKEPKQFVTIKGGSTGARHYLKEPSISWMKVQCIQTSMHKISLLFHNKAKKHIFCLIRANLVLLMS